ncbi:hypothetical protein TNCV_4559791 [Trichonephila clavipes]|nr:hypothetical protein TNCV_4559791 [Trichonephila clavipes]
MKQVTKCQCRWIHASGFGGNDHQCGDGTASTIPWGRRKPEVSLQRQSIQSAANSGSRGWTLCGRSRNVRAHCCNKWQFICCITEGKSSVAIY